ncbi:unnamed protein product [Fraxinus pennsylvanica]|uniref:RRM domain-containing protein n=1 Tax=Fraxinus pennsylvanica TaxID=56036 RepID=A0AAD1ZYT3_9LAMI|nr:unnamed protein product [Fraxinus pennsylvanica]
MPFAGYNETKISLNNETVDELQLLLHPSSIGNRPHRKATGTENCPQRTTFIHPQPYRCVKGEFLIFPATKREAVPSCLPETPTVSLYDTTRVSARCLTNSQGNSFLVPGATLATILMLGALHARHIYEDKKIEEAREKGVELEFHPDVKASFLGLMPLRSISRLWGSLTSVVLAAESRCIEDAIRCGVNAGFCLYVCFSLTRTFLQDLDDMNIEIMRNTLYKAYLQDFYRFCQGAPVKVRRPSDYNPSLAATLGPSQPDPTLNLAAVGLTPGSAGGLEGPDLIFLGGLPYYFTEAQIRELLESFGPLRKRFIPHFYPIKSCTSNVCNR